MRLSWSNALFASESFFSLLSWLQEHIFLPLFFIQEQAQALISLASSWTSSYLCILIRHFHLFFSFTSKFFNKVFSSFTFPILTQKFSVPSTPLPYPLTPNSWPWHFHVLRHIKFARPMGFSFQWWPTRPSSDTYAARGMSSGGYWLVHIVVPPIGLQIPLAPWVLSPAPPLGALW